MNFLTHHFPDTLPHSKEISLKADDFFSSLELRSSSKKPEQSTSGIASFLIHIIY